VNLCSNSAILLSYSASLSLTSFSFLLKAANLREKSSFFSGSCAASRDCSTSSAALSRKEKEVREREASMKEGLLN
jgi:hypothetical protein